jgi:hypothetical protein
MTVAPHQLPPPANPLLLPVLAAVTYLAALIAVWGLLSLALDRDVVDYAAAGPLLGPAMAAIATLVTFVALVRARRWRSAWPVALASILLAEIGMLAAAALAGGLEALLHFAISPFTLAAAALSGLVVVSGWAVQLRTRGLPPAAESFDRGAPED